MQPSMMHILEVVFALSPDSVLHRAMEDNKYTTSEDFIIATDETIDGLMFRGDGKNVNYQRQKQVYLEPSNSL